MFMVGFLGSRFLEMRLEGVALQTQLAHVFFPLSCHFLQLGNLPLRECFVPTRMYSNSFLENAIWPITVVGFLCLLLVRFHLFPCLLICYCYTVRSEYRVQMWFMIDSSWIKKSDGVVIDGCSKVPDEFVLQHISNANPPTLFMVLDSKSQICPIRPLL